MKIFSKIYDMIDNYLFKKRIGFSKSELKQLYINMLQREDEDWVRFGDSKDQDGNMLEIKNNIFRVGDTYIAINGNYSDATNLSILYGTLSKPELVLKVDTWQNDYIPGDWEGLALYLIRKVK